MISTRTSTFRLVHASGFLYFVAFPLTLVAQTPSPTGSSPDIDALLRQLVDERYLVREDATRRLCALGPQTADALRRVVDAGPGEAALRAVHLLTIFDRCYFWGAAVELAFSATDIPWDQSVDLIVTLRNPSPHSVRLPFELPTIPAESRLTDAQQVGLMLDLADFLRVTAPDGREIPSPHIDDPSDDPDVQSAIDARVEAPASTLLPPGQVLVLRLQDFNRGWARYRLLDAGTYKIAFEYRPDWSDPQLRDARIGYVAAAPVTWHVSIPAPFEVSRDGLDADLEIHAADGRLAAYLVNRRDIPQVIHTGFGPAAPFAQFAWRCAINNDDEIEIPSAAPKIHAADFRLSDLKAVEPGQRLLLTEIAVDELFTAFARASDGARPVTLGVRATYTNVVTRAWQRRENLLDAPEHLGPRELRAPLPRHILGTRLASEPILVRAP